MTELDLSGWRIDKVTSIKYMFYCCTSLIKLDITNFNSHNVAKDGIFGDCDSLTDLITNDEEILSLYNTYYKKSLFENRVNFNPVDYSDNEQDIIDNNTIDIVSKTPKNKEELTNIIIKRINENKFGDTDFIFPDLSDISVNNITDMSDLFRDALRFCISPIKLDLTSWDVSKVTDMRGMFEECYTLTELNLSGWDTSNVTNMRWLFCDCKKLKKLNISGWNTSNVTDMCAMFGGCEVIKKLDLSNWNTDKVTNMQAMFLECQLLEKLDISNFNTSNVITVEYIFDYCELLKNIITSDKLLLNKFNNKHIKGFVK